MVFKIWLPAFKCATRVLFIFFVYACACSNNLIIVLEDKRSINTELCAKRNLRVVYCLISKGYTWK